jgi:hypothetical protein
MSIREQSGTKTIERFYRELPPPDRLVMLGKGPSLERYDPAEYRDWPVWGLNETMTQFPCDYGCYMDGHFKDLHIPPGVVLIRPDNHSGHHGRRGYTYQPSRIADGFGPRYQVVHSTAAVSLYICGMWGVKKILLVGFDSWDKNEKTGWCDYTYAKNLVVLKKRSTNNYNVINRILGLVLAMWDFDLRWYHRGEDGKDL